VIDVGMNPDSRARAAELFGDTVPLQARSIERPARGRRASGGRHGRRRATRLGGVGPLTIAMLLKNTLTAAENRLRE
jgi:hypothetical protein